MGKSKQSLTHYPSQLDIEIDKYLDRGFKIINFNHMYQSTQHKLADQSDKSLKMAHELDNIKLYTNLTCSTMYIIQTTYLKPDQHISYNYSKVCMSQRIDLEPDRPQLL